MIKYFASKDHMEGWRVEGFNPFPVFIAIFIGPNLEASQKAAEEYADWQNQKENAGTSRPTNATE